MRFIWTGRHLLLLSGVWFAVNPSPLLAQKGAGARGGSSTSSPGTASSTGRSPSPFPSSTTTNNNTSTRNTSPSTGITTAIFLSGRVVFDDGSAPGTDIRIERVCGSNTRLETHTDSKGRFSFQIGQNNGVDADASDSGISSTRYPGANPGMSNSSFGGYNNLSACELRAAFPGYRSDVLSLSGRRALDNPEVGTIILHRLANVQGTTTSATTLAAPRHSQKEYEKGIQLAGKGKIDEAEEHLAQATKSYPRYAIAWFALGELQQREGKSDDARKAYTAAISADPKYVSPLDQMAFLSAQEGKWEDAADFSRRALDLNSVEFPASFWYNAVANYNLKKWGDSEKSLRQLLQNDTGHKYPGAESLLAQILVDKGSFTEAAVHMRTYLTLQPNAKNAEAVKRMLDRIDQAGAEAKK